MLSSSVTAKFLPAFLVSSKILCKFLAFSASKRTIVCMSKPAGSKVVLAKSQFRPAPLYTRNAPSIKSGNNSAGFLLKFVPGAIRPKIAEPPTCLCKAVTLANKPSGSTKGAK